MSVEQLFGLARTTAAEPPVLLALAALGVLIVIGVGKVYRRRK